MRVTSLATACCSFFVVTSSAFAQTAAQGDAAATEGETSLEEVVVTAEKRSEDLEKAPLAVTAVTSSELATLGVTTSEDLSAVVPSFSAAPNSNGSTVAMRGIVSTNQSVNGNSEVSFSEDGVGMVNMRAAFSGLYDVDRIEVFRGPQGTLYGANANAGGINVVTNKPDLTAASASGSVGVGNYQELSTSATMNVPLSDVFGIRLAADQEKHEGYVDLTTNNTAFEDQDFVGARIHMLYKPSDNFSALLTYESAHNGGAGAGGSGSGAPLGLYAAEQGVSPYSYGAMPGALSLDERINSGTLTLNWSLPFFDVTNISSARFDNWLQSIPETLYGPDATYCQNIKSTNCNNPAINSSINRQITEELRLSKSTESLHWLLGAYFMKYDADLVQSYEPSQNKPTEWEIIQAPDYLTESKAIYGQTTWDITKALSIVGGLRYQDDWSILPYSPVYYGPIGAIVQQVCIGCTVTSVYSGYGSWGKTTWRAGVNYNLTPGSFLFASVATGYEEGGFSTKAEQPFNPVYGPENLINYEIGSKNQFFNNRAQVNLDLYYMDYKNFQAGASETLANGTEALLTSNAGRAVIKGVELESAFLVTPYDRITFNATAINAEFTEFYLPLGDGYAPLAGLHPTNYTGNSLPYAPHETARIGLEHTLQLNASDSLIPRVDSTYSTRYFLDYHDYSATEQGAYSRTGASLTWERKRNDYIFSTELYVRNLENTAVLVGGQADNNAPGRDFNQYGKNGYYLPPRTYGIRFRAAFK